MDEWEFDHRIKQQLATMLKAQAMPQTSNGCTFIRGVTFLEVIKIQLQFVI